MKSKQTGKIAIVGNGPAGLVMAIALARRGIPSTVFEQDLHPEEAPRFNPERSYTIDITGHGLNALRHIDATEIFDEQLIPFKGIVTPQVVEEWKGPGWTGSRGDILCALMLLVKARYKKYIKFNFSTRVVAVDAKSGTVKTEPANGKGKGKSSTFDLIIAGDGGGSVVRRSLQEQFSDFKATRTDVANYATMLELDLMNDRLDKRYLQVLNLFPTCVAGAINGDTGPGSARWFSMVGVNHKMSFASADEAMKFFRKKAPRVLEYASEASIASFAERECRHIGRRVTCSRLNAGRVILLGDAAAPFSPIGQGINAAMESAIYLDRCIEDTSPDDLVRAGERFNRAWKPEADAISWISEQVIFGRVSHILRMVVTAKLGINVVSDAKRSDISYSEAARRGKRIPFLWS